MRFEKLFFLLEDILYMEPSSSRFVVANTFRRHISLTEEEENLLNIQQQHVDVEFMAFPLFLREKATRPAAEKKLHIF